MAKSLTARFGLQRWTADTDTQGRDEFDADNAALAAAAAGFGQGRLGLRPAAAAAYAGFFWVVTSNVDGGVVDDLYYCDGASWALMNHPDLSGFATTGALAAGLAGKLGATAKAADSDLLDGIDSATFARRDQANNFAGTLNVTAGQLQEAGARVYSPNNPPPPPMSILGGARAFVINNSSMSAVCSFVAPASGKVAVDISAPSSSFVQGGLSSSDTTVLVNSASSTFAEVYYSGLTPGATYTFYAMASSSGVQIHVVVEG